MSSVRSDGGRPREGRPVRDRKMTSKGRQYSLQLLYADSKRIVRRLGNQKELFKDLLKTSNIDMMDREVKTLDEMHQQLLETYAQVREILQADESPLEGDDLKKLVEVVDTEDSAIFQIKKDVSAWMITQTEGDNVSVASRRTGRSRRTHSILSRRSSRSGSVHSGSFHSERSESVESVRSCKSDSSRLSRKAKVAGLKAEVQVLKDEGKTEIQEQVRLMKLEAEKYEREQNAILISEIAHKENLISQEEHEAASVKPDQHLARKDTVTLADAAAEMQAAADNLKDLEQAEENEYDRSNPQINGDYSEPVRKRRFGHSNMWPWDRPQEEKDANGVEQQNRKGMQLDVEDKEKRPTHSKQPVSRREDRRRHPVTHPVIQPPAAERQNGNIYAPHNHAQQDTQDTQEGTQDTKDTRPISAESVPGESVAELSLAMMKMMKAQVAPQVSIDTFTGDVIEYAYFIANFKDMVESVVDDQRGRLNRLIMYTSGEAKELIRHCVHNHPERCYDDALSLLTKEYGDPVRIACAYMEKLKGWPLVKQGDGAGLKGLYRFLLQCEAYQRGGGLTGLDSPILIRSIQLKLPVQMQDKWSHVACKMRKHQNREAVFADFMNFVESESSAVNDPLYSRSGINSNNDKGLKALATKTITKNTPHGPKTDNIPDPKTENTPHGKSESTPDPNVPKTCACCSQQHELDNCEVFLKKTLKERKQLVFSNRLCFCCFGTDHKAEDCTQKKICSVCSQSHPTALHVYKTLAIGDRGDGAGMCVVPVRLRHKDNPDEEILVYAMLDECSQGTFIKEDILMRFTSVKKEPDKISTYTFHGDETASCLSAQGFTVTCAVNHESEYSPADVVRLPKTYSRLDIPLDEEDVPSKEYVKKWDYLERVSRSLCDKDEPVPVGLLIGRNCPKAMEPLEVIPSKNDGPYATRTRLGWCVSDATNVNEEEPEDVVKVNFVRTCWPAKDVATGHQSSVCFSVDRKVTDYGVEQSLREVHNADTVEPNSEKACLSNEDRQFLKIMKDNIRLVDEHYELPLPFREDKPNMPQNRKYCLKRLHAVKQKMLKDKVFQQDYTNFMMKFIDAGYARKAVQSENETESWYLPHHAVYHPTKKKIRIVLDCSAEYQGVSLNSKLLQGPDLTNHLIGVFARFRQEPIAVIGDIKEMFCQVLVPEHQRKFLRFVFWPDGDLTREPQDYEMCVHVFGAVSSMGCVNYALRQAAEDNEAVFGAEAADTLRKKFYVDDLATSVVDEPSAIDLIKNTDGMCAAGGFSLTKIMCTSSAVMDTVPVEKHSEAMKMYCLGEPHIVERPLGVLWIIEIDCLGIVVAFRSGALTRRGILATINSIYDLLGIASPFLLKGRKVLQEITGEKVSWDAEIDDRHVKRWNAWKDEVVLLQDLTFPRCYKPSNFGKVVDVSLHTFADGCNVGYGAASYIRQVDETGNIAVSLVMGKSRVSPLKMITIPRLELTAAVVAVKLGALVREELGIDAARMFYYSDNKVALGYICNDVKRFRVFVGNRHQLIRTYSSKEDWSHVDTKENPADDASRGLSMKQKEKVQRWLYGPEKLHRKEADEHKSEVITEVEDGDPEVVKVVNVCNIKPDSLLDTLEKRVSRWSKTRRIVAVCRTFIKKVKQRVADKRNNAKRTQRARKLEEKELRQEEANIIKNLTVEDLREADKVIIRLVQERSFKQEMSVLAKQSRNGKANNSCKKSLRKIYKLDPFIDEEGILRVGGRLRHSKDCDDSVKFPVILPRKALTSKRIAEFYHQSIHHGGRASSVNEVRSNGYWIIGITGILRSLIYRCVACRCLRGSMGVQKMADLPAERVSSEAPFTYNGVDMFGPFTVKEGRKEHKRYVALFTCFSSRAVHMEVTASMDTDSFIQALRRFVARRGAVRTIRSDNGGNFVGAENEMKKAWKEMDHARISSHLKANNCDWINWEKNVPVSSHMGGVWERQIRTVRSVLTSILKSHTRSLDNESFCTLIAEVEAIVNSRPLTLEDINDPESMPITPSHLLTLKSKVVMPPPGVFQGADAYSRKRWRVVQQLANTFWSRWRKEYLATLQSRAKWTEKKRNFMVGDVVLLKDEDVSRNNWPMGVIVATFPSDDGLVRSVEVRLASQAVMKRPIVKLVLLLESSESSSQESENITSDEEASSRADC